METRRRNFLKIAGLTALGLGCGTLEFIKPAAASEEHAAPAAEPVSAEGPYAPNDTALHGQHWGMVIDTRAFENPEDYQVCIDACHSYHNVPNIPSKQNIMWLWTDKFNHVFPEKETHYQSYDVENKEFFLLCNHCEHPPCVRVCPTKATFKRESDGIVVMDMHRCIGCRFCMAACPFGARSFNFMDPRPYIAETNPDYPTRMKGVVEKCNFCAERLAVGQMPACVEASEGKILFGDLADPDSEVRQALAENFTIRRKVTLGTQPSVYYII